jgi:choline dehydrogenase-like flavoprotein
MSCWRAGLLCGPVREDEPVADSKPAQVLVVGSGAGGSVTALELARAGFDVVLVEEGRRFDRSEYGRDATSAMAQLYRRRGMTPILGRPPIGYVEGCCLGGSTEINSGFWHRTPREVLLRWRSQFELVDAMPDDLERHFEWAERELCVSPYPGTWPPSTRWFARGIERMAWAAHEVPRVAPGCASVNRCASGCPSGAKQGMTARLLPQAEDAGARILTRCRARFLLWRKHRVSGVIAELEHPDQRRELVRIDAEHVFVCAGPTETPALLLRSGIKYRVGDSLRIHPMLKVAARFPEPVDAHSTVLPLLQVKEFWPAISLGGSYSSLGHLAMLLSDSWPVLAGSIDDHRRLAMYYVAVKGTGTGRVRSSPLGDDEASLRYQLSAEDLRNLSMGLARLSALLLAAGAETVHPAISGLPTITSELDAVRWLDEIIPRNAVSLSTVHAFSSCPIGERVARTAADSFGRVHGFRNLYLNDASIIPDSPGVNPQGTVMALARRNVMRFIEQQK